MSSPSTEATPNAQPLGVVPMPRWSNWVGCARVVIAVLVLAFTAAATAICGGYTGFGFALFTVSDISIQTAAGVDILQVFCNAPHLCLLLRLSLLQISAIQSLGDSRT